ncbi:MAG: hypothetical protein LKH33_10340 [Acetobacter sp.]|nr:hypothetical protein [Acetobacter sp.]MCH4060538.1 hypothetical protein [Acetobacter sp.]MCH4087478.1 hypothetical protein [Acetobacter sp.]MCI1294679.1 hypothetical protein [Acetobacter sp.]MCI1321172.1 hypothetical protein [Acetobacter sp.]
MNAQVEILADGATDTDQSADTVSANGKKLPEGCVLQADGSIVATLNYPVDGQSSVTLNRLRGRAMVNMMNQPKDGDRSKALILGAIGLVGPKGDAFYEKLDGLDILNLAEASSYFLQSGPLTGHPASQVSPAS